MTVSEQLQKEAKQLEAELYQKRSEHTRALVVENDDPDWLSSAGKYMVSMNLDGDRIEVGVYRHSSMQSSGSIEKADIRRLIQWLQLVSA